MTLSSPCQTHAGRLPYRPSTATLGAANNNGLPMPSLTVSAGSPHYIPWPTINETGLPLGRNKTLAAPQPINRVEIGEGYAASTDIQWGHNVQPIYPCPNNSNISDRHLPTASQFTPPPTNLIPSRTPPTYQGGFIDYTKPDAYAKKAQLFCNRNIGRFIEQTGLDYIGIITLTFPKKMRTAKQAAKHFNNFNRRGMKVFKSWIRIFERHNDGSWHIHLIVAMPFAIRAGFNVDLYNAHRLEFNKAKTAADQYSIICLCTDESHPLRQFWKDFQARLRAYHLGRFDILPILTEARWVARYYSKGISKTLTKVKKDGQRVRVVAYSQNFLPYGSRLSLLSPQSRAWRLKTGLFAKRFDCQDSDDLKALFGPRWGYYFKGLISYLALTPREVPGSDYLLQFKPFLSSVLDNEPHHQGDNRPAATTEMNKANDGLTSYEPDAYNEVIFRRVLKRYPQLEERFFAKAAGYQGNPSLN